VISNNTDYQGGGGVATQLFKNKKEHIQIFVNPITYYQRCMFLEAITAKKMY